MAYKIQVRHDEEPVYVEPTKKDLDKKYFMWAMNFVSGSPLETYLPLHMYRRDMTEYQRCLLWDAVDDFVSYVERTHFKLIRQPEEYHLERIIAFYDLAKVRWENSVSWICKAYIRGFSEIEGLLQMRRLGISTDVDPKDPLAILEYKKWYVKHFVMYFDFKRTVFKAAKEGKVVTFNSYYFKKKGNFPTKVSIELWEQRCFQLEQLINRCPHLQILGFKQGRSLDELYETEFGHDGS